MDTNRFLEMCRVIDATAEAMDAAEGVASDDAPSGKRWVGPGDPLVLGYLAFRGDAKAKQAFANGFVDVVPDVLN